MAEPGSIKRYFTRVEGLLPIHWIPSAEPRSKRPKRGPGRPLDSDDYHRDANKNQGDNENVEGIDVHVCTMTQKLNFFYKLLNV